MRKLALSVAAIVVLASISFAGGKLSLKGSKGARTFTGEIIDSQCAPMGTHDPVGYKMTNTTTPKDCTFACVKMGGKFTLYDATKKVTYQLDDQDKPKDFAGQKVKVTGTYDSKAKTIHVQDIVPAA